MDGSFLRGLEYFAIVFIVAVPLGLWKLVEIIIWLFQHIKIV